MPSLVRIHRPVGPYSLDQTLSCFRHGAGDPTCRVVDGAWWLGQATPDGPATLSIRAYASAGRVEARAWGPGARWALEAVPELLGAEDDPSGLVPRHDVVARAMRAHPGLRVPKSRLVVQSLVAAIIEQRVTGKEAFGSQRRVVRRFGTPAPGPGLAIGLFVPPAPREWGVVPSWEWLGAGVERARSGTVMRVSRVAGRLEESANLPLPEAHRRMRSIAGVGEWTAAETAQRALGDADSPSFGDFHVAKDVGWALAGRPFTDDEMREELQPYAGHRYRVQRLLELAGHRRPRHGPRMRLPTHLPRVLS
ncbi:conserved hypothetical protein [Nostocoides japonicum T1-X7]|uniref:3-methyladenine DNA glycosylase/8-oxoguanine DNA glycosylase n=1 Tax=Nostocoides japonicum T1-X7 TaxID=1194083 RepID=A0A077LZF1_9MICO|nr:DNA-3-methyladenine glycosylase 2 family protein [Tetrasphaera japonica]CCH78262.1 conserved hypothetical protein [Tetrasphaera japonica T1-X7]